MVPESVNESPDNQIQTLTRTSTRSNGIEMDMGMMGMNMNMMNVDIKGETIQCDTKRCVKYVC